MIKRLLFVVALLVFVGSAAAQYTCSNGRCYPTTKPQATTRPTTTVDAYGRLCDAYGRPYVDSEYHYLDASGQPMTVTAQQGPEAIATPKPTPTPNTPQQAGAARPAPTQTQDASGSVAHSVGQSDAVDGQPDEKPDTPTRPTPGIDVPYSGGWVPNPEKTEEFIRRIPILYHHQIETLSELDDNADRLLYRYVVRLAKDSGQNGWTATRDGKLVLRAYNQGSVGSCTGNAAACVVTTLSACEIVMSKKPHEFKAFASAEALYGLGREKANMLGQSGDGCFGASLADAVTEYGTLYCMPYSEAGIDLTTYSETRCKAFGKNGVGEKLKTIAADHQVLNVVNVKNAKEAWSLVGSGYPINVCSDVGFQNKRGAEGVIEPKGTWNHAMAITARRTSEKYGRLFLIQNSWGDEWNPTGYADDEPNCSFWVREEVINKMLGQGDSFAYSGLNGFRRQNLPDLGTIYP